MSDKALKALKPWMHGVPGRDGECRAFCPACENPQTSKSPSASFNFQAQLWHCMSCGKGGSFRTLLRLVKEGALTTYKAKAQQAENVSPIAGKPLPTRKQLMVWHKRMKANKGVLRIMTEQRGLTMTTLKRHLVGYDGQRYTIPIFDADGELVNVRRYKPNARAAKDKMFSISAGHGSARLYGMDILQKHDDILLTEGELDRLIALQEGMPAVAHTGGAAVFKAEWAVHFKGKRVYIAYDEDKAGDNGALAAAKILKQVAEAVYRVKLGTGIDGGDVTDFFVAQGRRRDDMWQVMNEATPLFLGKSDHVVPVKGRVVSVEESKNPAYDEPLELTAMVSGIFDPPYYVPKEVTGTCDQAAGAAKCAVCPFAINDGERSILIERDDPRLLKFVDAGEKYKHELLVEFSEAHCRTHVQFDVKREWPIEMMAITPSVQHRTEAVETPINRVVYNVGTYKTPVNHLARVVGSSLPDPRTQRSTFMGWQLDPVATDLDTFRMTPKLREQLLMFRPDVGQSPLEKCIEIAEDLAANVSHIYGRPMLHVGYDLVWHSLTSFKFEGKNVTKGWLECLVIGDTRTGKSETATSLAGHYQSGIIHSLETTSLAGLVGGAQQMSGKNWMVTWGLIPLNDRRLIVLDEMSGLFTNRDSKGIIEAMSSVRSEGKAQVNKIAQGETSARTRLIWLSNPLSSTSLSEAANGSLPALQELVRNPEDVARFDFMMAVAGKDVASSLINSTKHRRVKHQYKSDLAAQLVMWAWSRRADQVKFLKGVEEYIYGAAEDLGSRYVSDPPLIQIANVRIKVARLAVAFAARTFSADAQGECVLVKRSHVKAAVQFLDSIYGEPAMGYRAHSDKITENRKRAEKAKEEARKYLRSNQSLIETLLAVGATDFRKRDFEEFGGVDRDDVGVIIPKLLGWRLIARKSRGYMTMEPALVELLRELEAEGS